MGRAHSILLMRAGLSPPANPIQLERAEWESAFGSSEEPASDTPVVPTYLYSGAIDFVFQRPSTDDVRTGWLFAVRTVTTLEQAWHIAKTFGTEVVERCKEAAK